MFSFTKSRAIHWLIEPTKIEAANTATISEIISFCLILKVITFDHILTAEKRRCTAGTVTSWALGYYCWRLLYCLVAGY